MARLSSGMIKTTKNILFCQDIDAKMTKLLQGTKRSLLVDLLGLVTQKPVNANPGLKVNQGIIFSTGMKLFFTSYMTVCLMWLEISLT